LREKRKSDGKSLKKEEWEPVREGRKLGRQAGRQEGRKEG